MDEIKEFIELKFIDIKKYIDDCFEEQSKNNSIFFDNILELIKANISKETELNNKKMAEIISTLEKSSETNKAISNKVIDSLKEIDNIYAISIRKEEKENIFIYNNLKKGIKQFSIQLVIVVIILLIILGAYQLISLIF